MLLLLLLLLALLLLYGDCPICLLHDACVEIAYEGRLTSLFWFNLHYPPRTPPPGVDNEIRCRSYEWQGGEQ